MAVPGDSDVRRCELCGREVALLTRHHLIPRMRHRQPRTRRTFGLDQARGRIALFCKPCHKQVHAVLDEKQLEESYNTLESLARHPEIAKFVRWIRRRPDGTQVVTYRSAAHAKSRRRH